jgi:pimeloyl-ACP methyl ester carboxylesterase
MHLPLDRVPEPDPGLEPAGFIVDAGGGERIHFLDWSGDAEPGDAERGHTGPGRRGVLAIHGLAQTAWLWAPVARRLGGPRGPVPFVAMDLRGHGLSDAPTEDDAYDLERLAQDAVAVAEGSGLLDAQRDVVLAGHGFGAIVAAVAATRLAGHCAGLLLVDGGWESLSSSTGVDADEFLRGLDEPPEVMRSMTAFLADRRAFDPGTWDDDQDRAARATVVETHAGRVVPSARPHATEASVRSMFTYDPLAILPAIAAPVLALQASGDEPDLEREGALDRASEARVAAGRSRIESVTFGGVGHNLMRYRPREVAAAILALVG